MLLGIPVVDGHSEELIDWYERCLPDLDEAAGPEIDFRCIGDPGRSGPVHQSLLTPEERERDARDAAFYVESVHQTGRGRAHRLDGMKQLRQMLRLESDAIPCVAFVRPGQTEVVGLLRIAPHWYGTRSAGQAFARCLCAWLARKDVKKVATDGTAVAVTTRRLEPLLEALTTEIETAVATSVGTEPDGSTPGNVFRFDGEHWRIVWRASQLAPMDDSLGLQLLHNLLERPETDHAALPLVSNARKGCRKGRGESRCREANRHTDSVELSESTRTAEPAERSDSKSFRALVKRLRELKDLREVVESEGAEASEELRAEIACITDRLQADFAPGGRPRFDDPDRRKAQMSVNKALKSALAQVGLHCPELRQHLENSIHKAGAVYSYRPVPMVDWHCDVARLVRPGDSEQSNKMRSGA